MLDIKYVPYYRAYNGHIAQIAYVILGDNCVFTACEPASLGSSINFAEAIARSVAHAEQRPVESLRWFDMQTRYSYGRCYTHRPNPGDFVFDEVVFATDGTSWRPTVCPKHVSDMFKHYYIDGEPNQVLLHGVEEAQKVHFHNPYDDPVPPLDEYRVPPAGVAKLAEAALKMGAKCWDCGGELSMTDIRFDDHDGGWEVEGMNQRQWLWFECSNGRCRYQTAFAKLHFPGNVGDSHRPHDGEQMH
jgi:hypothetical protein